MYGAELNCFEYHLRQVILSVLLLDRIEVALLVVIVDKREAIVE